MEDNEWKKVVNVKKQKYKKRAKERDVEKTKWDKLRNDIPHIVLPSRAKRLRCRLNIALLDERLISDPFIDHQAKGWKYVKVLKPDEDDIPQDTESILYSTLELDNNWGDVVLFSMEDIEKSEDEVIS